MSKSVKQKEMDAYLRESQSWETDRFIKSERSKKVAWIVAAVASGVAVANSLSTALMATRQPDPPVVLKVNETRGTVEIQQRLTGGDTTYDEVVRKYWTEQYVMAREGFMRQIADDQYNKVGLMSGSVERKRFGDWFNPKNPTSPLNQFGEGTRVRIYIKGTTFIKPTVALVRYTKQIERPGQEKPEVTYWAATVNFKFSGAPMKEVDRRVNPLGYQAIEYRVDPDAASGELRSDAPAQAPQVAQQPTNPAAQGVVLFPGVPNAPAQQPGQVPAIQAQ